MISWPKYRLNKSDLVVILSCLGFLIYKLANLTFRFGDGNAYLYMLDQLWQGHLPYRDFFTADPPGFLLFLSFVRIFFGRHWLWYQAVPIILQTINAFLLWRLLRPVMKFAWLAPMVYLCSFTVLATSDFSTGGQLVVGFVLLGYWAYQKQNRGLSGIFWALAVLTKLYALPALLGFVLYLIIYKKFSWRFAAGLVFCGLTVLLPFFAAAPQAFVNSIIIHQLHRTGGLNIWDVWKYFFSHEWAFWLAGLLGLFDKSLRQYFWPFVFTGIFFLFFKDLYYLYLSFLFLFLVIFAVGFINRILLNPEIKPLGALAVIILVLNLTLGFYWYQTGTFSQGRFTNAEAISEYIKIQTTRSEIYGSHELVPLIGLLSGRKLFGNYIDTNTQVFSAGTLDLTTVSRSAVGAGVYLIARISDYPELGIKPTGFEGYFSRTEFDQFCQPLKMFTSTSNENDNYIGIYDCKTPAD